MLARHIGQKCKTLESAVCESKHVLHIAICMHGSVTMLQSFSMHTLHTSTMLRDSIKDNDASFDVTFCSRLRMSLENLQRSCCHPDKRNSSTLFTGSFNDIFWKLILRSSMFKNSPISKSVPPLSKSDAVS